MRKFRNPRYAPEYLERKLIPSSTFAGIPYTATYGTYDTSADPSQPPQPPSDGDPPIVFPPPLPIGPSGPA